MRTKESAEWDTGGQPQTNLRLQEPASVLVRSVQFHTDGRGVFHLRRLGVIVGLVITSATGVNAAQSDDGRLSPAAQTGARTPDFLFGRPSATIGVRALWRRARADSEIFDFTQGLLTLEKGDFSGPGIMVDVAFPVSGRLDLLFGFEFSGSSALSEYRDLVEDNDLPIEQVTSFDQVNLTGSVEFALLPRGRKIGRYAWIPSRVVPYVGGGGGTLWYEFVQDGDFVDFDDFSIFTARLTSSGWTPSAHVSGGVDVKLTQRFYVSGEVRYVWAQTDLSRDFIDFDEIDLTGLRMTGGIQFVF